MELKPKSFRKLSLVGVGAMSVVGYSNVLFHRHMKLFLIQLLYLTVSPIVLNLRMLDLFNDLLVVAWTIG